MSKTTKSLTVKAQSWGYDDPKVSGTEAGDNTFIIVNGKKYKAKPDALGHTRGHEVFIFNELTGELVEQNAFDTWDNKKHGTVEAKRLTDYLEDVEEGRIIAIAVNDSGDTPVNLAPYGSTITSLGNRESYAMITQKGETPSWFVEKKSARGAGPTIVETSMLTPAAQLKTFAEENFTGDEVVYTEEDAKVEQTTCSSINVTKGEWLVHGQEDFQGGTALLQTAFYTTQGAISIKMVQGTWNGQVRSLRPVNQHGLTLFDKNFYCGHPEIFPHSEKNVENMQLCRSFIIRDGKWELYSLGGYEGEPIATKGPGEYDVTMFAPDQDTIAIGSVKKI